MATATANPPIIFADTKSPLGHAHAYAMMEMYIQLRDTLNVLGLGVMELWGDFAGRGTDVIRVTDYGGVGFDLPMTELAAETDEVAPSAVDLGYEEMTLGQYGLGHEESYKHQLLTLGQHRPVTVDGLKGKVPASFLRTLRDLVCTVGAGFTLTAGSTSTTLSVSDFLDLLTVYRTAEEAMMPTIMADATPIDQLIRSFANEQAYSQSATDFASITELKTADGSKTTQIYENFAGLGPRLVKTSSVVQSGGAYQNFSTEPGGIGWGRCNTAGLVTANPNGTVLVPEFGLVIEELTSGAKQTVRGYRATSFVSVAAGSARTFNHRRLLSTT